MNFLIFIIVVGVIYEFCKEANKTKEVSVDELCTNYSKYAAKEVVVSGIIESIDVMTIVLVGHKGKVFCYLENWAALALSPGENVSVMGTCAGANPQYGGMLISLHDCSVKA